MAEEYIDKEIYNETLQATSKTIFDGINVSLLQKGQNLNIFIANVQSAITSLNEAIASITVDSSEIATTGITSSIVSPTGKTLAEWLTSVSTYIGDLATTVSQLEASDISYVVDLSDFGKGTTENVAQAINSITEIIKEFATTDLYNIFLNVQMPFYPFYTGSLTITDTTVTTPQVTIDDLTMWGINGEIEKPSEVISLTDEKTNYIYISRIYNLIAKLYKVKYGYLYNWYAVTNVKGFVNDSYDFTVPTSAQYTTLMAYLGGSSVAGDKLKETGTTYWNTNTGTNDYNFNGRGAGYRNLTVFQDIKNISLFLTTTIYDAISIYIFGLIDNDAQAYILPDDKHIGFSIRLVRNATVTEQTYTDGTYCENYIGNDGRSYKTVKIGTQVWTAENSAETKYNDGTFIQNITDGTLWSADTTGAMCSYNNDDGNVLVFDQYTTEYSTKYIIRTTDIGDPVPDFDEILVAAISVTGGTVGTPVIALKTAPIEGTVIANDTIEGKHILMASTFSAGFSRDAVTKIISPVVQKSIELLNGIPQLKNDETTPSAYYYYGTNAGGTKGYHDFPYKGTANNYYFQLSDGLNSFRDIKTATSIARYYGTEEAYTFGLRAESIGDRSFVIGQAEAINKGEVSCGYNGTTYSSSYHLITDTEDETETYMSIDGDFIQTTIDTMMLIDIDVIASDFTNGDVAIFDRLRISLINNNGTLSLGGSITVPTQSTITDYSNIECSYDVAIESDVLHIKVTGVGATSIRWVAKLGVITVNNKSILS